MNRKLSKILLSLSVAGMAMLSPAGLTTSHAKKNQDQEIIEKFRLPVYDNIGDEKRAAKQIGYKDVRSNVIFSKKNDDTKSTIYISKEDFFDLNGNYLRTEIEYSEYIKNVSEKKAKNKFIKKQISKQESKEIDQNLESHKKISVKSRLG